MSTVLLQARARGHAYFPILDAWVAGKFTLAVSTGILLEYEEVIARMSGREHWHKFARLMDYVELTAGYHPQPITPAEFISKHL